MAALVEEFSGLFFKVRGQEMLGGGEVPLKAVLFMGKDLAERSEHNRWIRFL